MENQEKEMVQEEKVKEVSPKASKINSITIILCLISLILGGGLGYFLNPNNKTVDELKERVANLETQKETVEKEKQELITYKNNLYKELETMKDESRINQKVLDKFLSSYFELSFSNINTVYISELKKVCLTGIATDRKHEPLTNTTLVVVSFVNGEKIFCSFQGDVKEIELNQPIKIYGLYGGKMEDPNGHLILSEYYFQ